MSENKEATQEVTQEAPAVSAEPVQLTVNDLQGLANVVDLASRRGAFQANEMADVGTVYNKLVAFVKQVSEAQKAQTDETPAE